MKYLNIFKANKEIERLEGLIESSKADASAEGIKAKDEEIANLRQTIAAYPGVKQQYDSDIEVLKSAHEKAIKDLTDGHEAALTDLQGQLETAKTETNVKVHSVISSLGVSTEAVRTPVEDNNNNQTPEAISAQFHSMKPGADRQAFYEKHKKAILSVRIPLKQ